MAQHSYQLGPMLRSDSSPFALFEAYIVLVPPRNIIYAADVDKLYYFETPRRSAPLRCSFYSLSSDPSVDKCFQNFFAPLSSSIYLSIYLIYSNVWVRHVKIVVEFDFRQKEWMKEEEEKKGVIKNHTINPRCKNKEEGNTITIKTVLKWTTLC